MASPGTSRSTGPSPATSRRVAQLAECPRPLRRLDGHAVGPPRRKETMATSDIGRSVGHRTCAARQPAQCSSASRRSARGVECLGATPEVLVCTGSATLSMMRRPGPPRSHRRSPRTVLGDHRRMLDRGDWLVEDGTIDEVALLSCHERSAMSAWPPASAGRRRRSRAVPRTLSTSCAQAAGVCLDEEVELERRVERDHRLVPGDEPRIVDGFGPRHPQARVAVGPFVELR